MAISTLNDLFLHTLRDVLFAEQQILKSLPKMQREASNPKLKDAFKVHLDHTKIQITRLEESFNILGTLARGEKCDAMLGLIEEADAMMADIDDKETMDAALAALAQSMGHQQIAQYGTLVAWAHRLGQPNIADLLKRSLDEEHSADRDLSKLATENLNSAALT